MSALNTLRKSFPQLKRIVDSKKSLRISVTRRDSSSARKKDPENCALARACVRQKLADAAIIGIAVSYLVKGDTAIRYCTSVGVGREITSFDRHQDFAEGTNYCLQRVSPSNRLNRKREGHRTGKQHPHVGKSFEHLHHTANVRVIKR